MPRISTAISSRRFSTLAVAHANRLRYSTSTTTAANLGNGTADGSQKSTTALQSIADRQAALKIARQQQHPVALLNSDGGSYSFSSYAAIKKRLESMMKNMIVGGFIASFAGFVYYYSIWAVRQDDLNEEFLDQMEKENSEYLHNIQNQKQ